MSSSVAAGGNVRVAYPWMFGRNFDLLFFFAPVLLGIGAYALSQSSYVSGSFFWTVLVLNAFGAGPFHWGPTWFAYFDKNNRAHYMSDKRLKTIFFAGPPLIMAFCVAGMFLAPWLVLLITSAWAIQHLVQQNVGILLLYHNHGKGEAIVPRPLEMRSQWAPAIFFSILFVQRILFKGGSNAIVTAMIALVGIWALVSVTLYVRELAQQIRNGAALNVPALIFWAISVSSLIPFAFLGKGFDDAYIIPVTIHWFQYIGLNYILIKYKYDRAENQAQNLVVSSPKALFFSVCTIALMIGLGLVLWKQSGQLAHQSAAFNVVAGVVFGLANIHYYLDAFLWRFREEYQRKTVLPYLLRPRQVKAT